MTKIFERIKQDMLSAQLNRTSEDITIDNIINRKETLLSAEHIIKLLDVSPKEFLELVNLPGHYIRADVNTSSIYYYKNASNSRIEIVNKELEKNSTFPKPDLYILGKARWKKQTFKDWLKRQFV